MATIDSTGMEPIIERLDALSQANERLMRVNRRLRFGVMGCGAVVATILIAGASAVPRALEANHFVLRDEAGKVRASLAIRPDGSPGLGFLDAAGRVRLSLELGPDGPSVNLMDGIGKPQAAMAVRPDGTPGIGLFDPMGQPRLSLDLNRAGDSALNLYGAHGLLRAALAIRPDGTPGLGLFDEEAQLRTTVENTEAPAGLPADRQVPH